MQKVLPPTYLWAAIGLMVALFFLFPSIKIISFPWSLVGLLPLIAGIALNLQADQAFHKAGTTVKPFLESNHLITDGVFRISRNPMYLGFVLILIGIAILLGALSPFVVIPISAVLMDRVFIQVEEKMLEEKFGKTWLDYQRKVRRWI